jgi:hypothetical protein
MVIANAQAYLSVGFEAAARGGKAEAWRAKWIGRGQNYLAMVDSIAIYTVWGAAEGEMPLEQIGLERRGRVVR